MKSFFKVFVILAIAFSFLNSGQPYAALIDKIKAVVNSEVITQSEIDRLLYPIYERYRKIYQGKELRDRLEEASQEILDQLIEDRLILSEAKKQGITVTEEEIDHQIEQIIQNFGDKKTLLKALHEQNLTINDLRNRHKDQIMIQKIIDREIRQSIQILPQEAENYYRTHMSNFKVPEQVRVSAILIRLKSERTEAESYTLASEILTRLKEGEDFYTLAKNYSEGMNAEEGGDMGYVRKGQMVDEIDRILFNLKIGQFSDLVKTSLGYHIFKVYDKKKERVIPMVEARPSIMDAIYREKVEKQFDKWLEELKENAFISIK